MTPKQATFDDDLAKTEAIVPATRDSFELLRLAIVNNLDLEKLKQFMDLRDREQARLAQHAFVAAMNEFKKNPPDIIRNRNGQHAMYATLDVICKAVMAELSKHGISHRWEYQQTGPEWITVSCILTHEDGHSERTTMGGPPDTEGPRGGATKNAIQALASTRTYLERYTLLGAVGLESANDTDGATAGAETSALEAIAKATSYDELDKAFREAWQAAKDNQTAKKQLADAKDKRRGELRATTTNPRQTPQTASPAWNEMGRK